MNIDDYQLDAARTRIYPGAEKNGGLAYLCLKLAGEAGEVAEKLAKGIRDGEVQVSPYGTLVDGVHPSDVSERTKDGIIAELGDVLWYLSNIADTLGVPLSLIAEKNLEKVSGRISRGTLGGSGDDR